MASVEVPFVVATAPDPSGLRRKLMACDKLCKLFHIEVFTALLTTLLVEGGMTMSAINGDSEGAMSMLSSRWDSGEGAMGWYTGT